MLGLRAVLVAVERRCGVDPDFESQNREMKNKTTVYQARKL